MALTTSIGKKAEDLVAKQLKNDGFKILDTNWKRPRCEIDIVALKDKIVYFTEVKFRSSSFQGGGIDYVTTRKLKQVEFAGRVWTQENDWGGDWRILAASVEQIDGVMVVKEVVEVS